VKHALAVLAGLAIGLPGMAALASMNGHASSGLPDRFVPWVRSGHHLRIGFAGLRTHAPAHQHASPHASPSPSAPASRPTVPRATVPRAAGPVPAASPAVRRPFAGLRVSIEAPHTVRPGGTYTYRVRLANRGSGTPGEITVHNVLPPGVDRTGTSLPDGAGGYAGGRDTTLVMPRLAPGSSATARFVVRVRPTAHGDLVARSRIVSIGGVRIPRSAGSPAKVSTRVR
jgi:uncharacterized repeat protein (TIGR01451 family)